MGVNSLQSIEAFCITLISSEYTKTIHLLQIEVPYSNVSCTRNKEGKYLGREVMIILQYL